MFQSITIDTVTHDDPHDELVLSLVEDGPWPSGPDAWRMRLAEIQNRIFAIADLAINGRLAIKFPDSRGKRVRIQVDSPRGCPGLVQELVSAASTFLLEDASYAGAIRSSTHVGGIRVVTGKQMDQAPPSSRFS